MRWPWLRRTDPEVKAATEVRDKLLGEADAAIRKVDRLQNDRIEEYAAAERLLTRKKR